MDRIERIQNLIDDLARIASDLFPDFTTASITIQSDGYGSVIIEEWEKGNGIPVEERKRRMIYDRWRDVSGNWSDDHSAEQNAYYKENNILLEKNPGVNA